MKLDFCTACAGKLTQIDDTTYRCVNGHMYWNNPRTAVGVVLWNDRREVLFSKRGIEPRKGTYDLPGGFLEYGESVYDAAKREMHEETGLLISDMSIVATYTVPYTENISVCDLIIVAKTWEGTIKPADDSEALEWHPIEFLDSESFSPNYAGLSKILRSHS